MELVLSFDSTTKNAVNQALAKNKIVLYSENENKIRIIDSKKIERLEELKKDGYYHITSLLEIEDYVNINKDISTEVKANMSLGIMLHFGIYSVYGYDSITSLRRRKMQNGSEWFKARLDETGKYRPVSGYKETQEFFEKNYKGKDYFDVIADFDEATKDLDFNKWFEYFKSLGVSYVILTSKHHDGFCLFNTKTTPHHSKRDLIDAFMEAGRKYGIKVGLYYSIMEFGKSVTKEFLNTVTIPQIEELRNYKPDMWFFDGNWTATSKYSHEILKGITDKLKKDNPNVLINDRIDGGNYKNYEDRKLPTEGEILDPNWESAQTIGLSWGYCSTQEDKDYKTGKELKEIYNKVTKTKGRLLLNLGPKSNGTFDEREVKSLNEFADLIKQ